MQADGFSLDDKRQEIADNDISDIIARYHQLDAETDRQRTDKSFLVPVDEIRANNYDLSINRYKEVIHEEKHYEKPDVIIQRIKDLDAARQQNLVDLETLIKSDEYNKSMSENILLQKSFSFAIRIVRFQYLSDSKKEHILSKQLLRSGTAVGALVREAQNAESKNDFIHKLAIAQKECDETIYWLELLKETDYLSEIEFESICLNAKELLKIIRSSILTTKQRILKK